MKKKCKVHGCKRSSCAREWCKFHYGRWCKNGDPGTAKPRRWDGMCTVCGARKVNSGRLCSKHQTERTKRYQAKHPEKTKAYARAFMKRRNRELRQKALDAYGRACACCGETHEEFLTIDHTSNDGAKHRRELFGNKKSNGITIYRWFEKNNYPKENFQTLCFNCNWAKSRGGCPHVREREEKKNENAIRSD